MANTTTQDLEQDLQSAGFFRSLWITAMVGARASANIMLTGNDIANLARKSTSYGTAVLEKELQALETL